MKAIRVRAPGGPEVMKLEKGPIRRPVRARRWSAQGGELHLLRVLYRISRRPRSPGSKGGNGDRRGAGVWTFALATASPTPVSRAVRTVDRVPADCPEAPAASFRDGAAAMLRA
jgi:hypothetical protein